MAVSAKRVVAVAAVLQNSVVGVLCESSGCVRNSPDMYVKCPFLSGPDVLVLPEKDEAVLQKDAGPFKKGPDVFYRCRNPLPFPFFSRSFFPFPPHMRTRTPAREYYNVCPFPLLRSPLKKHVL